MNPGFFLVLLLIVLMVTNTAQVIVGYNKHQVLTSCLDTVPTESRQKVLDQLWGISR